MGQFTEQARQVLSLAGEEAERLHHNTIGTEHVLLGLLRENDGIAGGVLRDMGLEYQQVAVAIAAFPPPVSTLLELSPDAERLLELAEHEAHRMSQMNIDTEHLLLGLMRNSNCTGVSLLRQWEIEPDEVRRSIRRKIQDNPVPRTRSEVRQSADLLLFTLSKPQQLSYSVLQSTENLLLEICHMVGESELTNDQGLELLTAFFITHHEKARLKCHFESVSEVPKDQCRVVIIDAATKETKMARLFLLCDFLNVINGFVLQALQRNQSTTIEFGDGAITAHLEFKFVEDNP